MARNKRIIQNTDEKKAEIIAAARMLFLEIGYDATSMSKLTATPVLCRWSEQIVPGRPRRGS